jgi:ubiquilin
MGPPPTQESMLEMMENPMFLSQMNEAMNNPAVVDMMMQNPMVGRSYLAPITQLT